MMAGYQSLMPGTYYTTGSVTGVSQLNGTSTPAVPGVVSTMQYSNHMNPVMAAAAHHVPTPTTTAQINTMQLNGVMNINGTSQLNHHNISHLQQNGVVKTEEMAASHLQLPPPLVPTAEGGGGDGGGGGRENIATDAANSHLEEAQAKADEVNPEEEEGEDEEPVIDIVINNVVCSFSVSCHLDLRNIALNGNNVEFRRENGMVTMKLRKPSTTASVWSSGKITCTGSTSESQARFAARRIARCLQKLGYHVRFKNFRIVNVLGTCTMPFGIRITQFSQKHREAASYEPELHPGVTYKINYPKATLKIFSTGSITVTAPSVGNVQCAIEHIYPLVQEFSKERSPEDLVEAKKTLLRNPVSDDESEDEEPWPEEII
ncbi:unnamed protein product [Meganyctiphanes norvegica]|uniref:TATA box-binding protein-like 1 n=1 Tax=Meganyctiphanes norvegica TaxID=48144 RepID=A0AAV2QP57_MEGNR